MSDLSQATDTFDRAVLESDAELAASVLDQDFAQVQVQPAAASVDRWQWLAAMGQLVTHGQEVLERFVHEDGATAAVLQAVRSTSTVDGADLDGIDVFTDVWRRGADGWKLWRRHRTPATVDLGEAEERRTARAADHARPEPEPPARATVTEVAAVLATIVDAGQDPAELTPEDMEQYVEAFRALKHQSEPA